MTNLPHFYLLAHSMIDFFTDMVRVFVLLCIMAYLLGALQNSPSPCTQNARGEQYCQTTDDDSDETVAEMH